VDLLAAKGRRDRYAIGSAAGDHYEIGKGVGQDKDMAIKLLSTASADGNLTAAITLGAIYMRPGGNLAMAMKQTEHAAKLGDRSSQLIVGRAYLKGTGVDADIAKAEFWLRKSAEGGNERARELVRSNFERK